MAKGPQGDIYSYNPKAVLTIRRASGDLPAVPYAAFGGLTLMAPLIEQGGVLRAPLGSIVFESNPQAPGTVRFLPGSLTSVSGAGLLMPYGGTVDGVKYLYAGNEVKPDATGSSGYDGRKIEIQGKAVEVAEGAVLDVSGGGELSGGAFVRGRGGSVDVLRYAMADANPGFGFSRSGNAVYAIVPGFAGNQAPIAADAGAGSPAVGRQVTIGAGVPGLPAGTYTLLPSTYALLPGAFRVELGAQGAYDASAVARAAVPGSAAAGWARPAPRSGGAADQPAVHAGRRAAAPCAIQRDLLQRLPPGGRGAQGTQRGLMTVDARALQLTLDEGAGMGRQPALSFRSLARFGVPKDSGGYAGSLVVNGPAQGLEILAAGQAPILGPKAAAIQASDLNALSAGAMFLGGTPGRGVYDSGQMDVYAKNTQLLVRSGAVLSAPEIFLYAASGGRGIVVEQGATLSTLGRGAAALDARTGTYYALTSGALLAVSNGLVNLMAPRAAPAPPSTWAAASRPAAARPCCCPKGPSARPPAAASPGATRCSTARATWR